MNAAGADTDTVLRKRQLTVRTTSSNGGNGFRVGGGKGAAAATPPEPVSPSARLLEDFFIVVVIGIATPVNDPVARAGIAAQFARYPRFRSIQVTDEDGGNPRWVRTTLNVDDHIIYPELDMDAVAADPDKAVEDYVASLSTKPMDESRPLWEFHVLDFPTSEAAATTAIRVHHSLGDGMSLLTLLMACTRSAADPARLPAMPPLPTRTGAIYARPRPPASAGALAFAAWLWSFVALAWHTVVDVASFFATTMLRNNFVSILLIITIFVAVDARIAHAKPAHYTTLSLASATQLSRGPHEMDAGAGAATALRKRQLTVRTTSSNGGNGFRVGDGGGGGSKGAAAATPPEPVSPSARLVEDFFIVVVIGIATPVNDPVARAGIAAQLARYPRFRSIQVTDEDGGNPRWVRTTVNLDDHIIYPELDMDAVAADPDKAVEDYVASLSTKPMDELPAMPPLPTRAGAIYARPRPPASAGALAFAAWLWSFVALAWHTVVDVASFFATTMFLKDPHTLFKRVKHGEFQRKRIVHRGLSLDDVKLVKNAMNCADKGCSFEPRKASHEGLRHYLIIAHMHNTPITTDLPFSILSIITIIFIILLEDTVKKNKYD
uniref:diacylglycerol O-acyltransferase n=1 Tax=Oryza glumipatula TaxID=40148 RepID=A0A0D9YFH7_9ORYZ